MDRSSKSRGFKPLLLTIASTFAIGGGQAQEEEPPVLKSQGSFFVGGQIVETDAASGVPGGFSGLSNTGRIAAGQMYVRYQIPQRSEHR